MAIEEVMVETDSNVVVEMMGLALGESIKFVATYLFQVYFCGHDGIMVMEAVQNGGTCGR